MRTSARCREPSDGSDSTMRWYSSSCCSGSGTISISALSRSGFQERGTRPSSGTSCTSMVSRCEQLATTVPAAGAGYWQFQVPSVSCSGVEARAFAGASSSAEGKATRKSTPWSSASTLPSRSESWMNCTK